MNMLYPISYSETNVAIDGNGNILTLVNSSDGSTVASYEYSPFGECIKATGPMAQANPFRFSTKYSDDETDLIYYGYRYYDAKNGRWVSRDLIGEEGGVNLYGFVGNNGVNDFDLIGKMASSPNKCCRYTGNNVVINKTKVHNLPNGNYLDFFLLKNVYFMTKRTCKCEKLCNSFSGSKSPFSGRHEYDEVGSWTDYTTYDSLQKYMETVGGILSDLLISKSVGGVGESSSPQGRAFDGAAEFALELFEQFASDAGVANFIDNWFSMNEEQRKKVWEDVQVKKLSYFYSSCESKCKSLKGQVAP